MLEPAIDTGGPMGRMVLTVLGMVAEMELGFIRDRQRAGIDAAKAKGDLQGSPCHFDRARIVALRKEGMGATSITKADGCKRGNVHKATNKATPGRSRRVPTNKNNPAQDVATPPSVPIITAASSTCDLRRRYASLNRNRRLSTGPAASNCSASASTQATRARRVERTPRRDAIPESRKTGVSATWMTCATPSTLSRPSMCHHRAVFVAGLSKPMLLRQSLPPLPSCEDSMKCEIPCSSARRLAVVVLASLPSRCILLAPKVSSGGDRS